MNTFSREGAAKLAARVKKYWMERGAYPDVWLEQAEDRDGTIFVVRSDMVDGKPRVRL